MPLFAEFCNNRSLVPSSITVSYTHLAVDPLIVTLKDEDWRVRGGAAWALGKIANKKAVEPLIEAMKDDSGFVRGGAAWALGNIGDERGIEPLKIALNDKSSYVKRVAEKYLKKLD